MNVYVNKISGIDDAIVSMFMSKRTWTHKLEEEIRELCEAVLDRNGKVINSPDPEKYKMFEEWIGKLVKWGTKHITMLRFIEFSITVEGIHRAGQDDWDAHAQRFSNRIIRTSTRMAKFGYEMSDFYQGKILPTDMAIKELGIELPDRFFHEGKTFVKCTNGYVDEEYASNQDVIRGLYMLSIPSNFIFKVNLTEWAHVCKERNKNGMANPEVKQCCEDIASALEDMIPQFNRELFEKIQN